MKTAEKLEIRPVSHRDRDIWLEMRLALWPDSTAGEVDLFLKTRKWPAFEASEVLIGLDRTGKALGFVELSVRPFAEGCSSAPVAYLEGIYVCPENRRAGIGRALLQSAESWARSQDLTELASDAQIANAPSLAMHEALDFHEVDRIVCYAKSL